MTPRYVLLASYPKSGNTWLRMVLSNLLHPAGGPVSINEIPLRLRGCDRETFDELSPWPAADLRWEEIALLLPDVLRQQAAAATDTLYLKVHARAHRTQLGEWIYPPDCVATALYLVRHPLDVAMSFANHYGFSLESTVDAMTDEAEVMPPQRRQQAPSLPEWFGSWATHTASWLDAELPYRVCRARYEDLLRAPEETFGGLIAGAGIAAGADELRRAIDYSRFDRLQAEEAARGFRERQKYSGPFFRGGRAGSWQGRLGEELRRRLVERFAPEMERLGYGADGSVGPVPEGFCGCVQREAPEFPASPERSWDGSSQSPGAPGEPEAVVGSAAMGGV